MIGTGLACAVIRENVLGLGHMPHSRRLFILITCLGLIAALSALWPIYRSFLNIDIDLLEGWNAYYADAAMGRMPLYPSSGRLITNNYPPLSFYIVGLLGRVIGDTVLAGRLLSMVAVAVCAAVIALIIRRLGGTATAAGIGAAYFTATMCRFFTDYVGMNDPHLLAQAVMALGFLAFLRAMARNRGYAMPILVMAVSGFIKHSIIVMPLTAMIWLGIHRPRQMLRSGLFAFCVIAAGFALCFCAFGPDFFANMTSPRAFLLKHAWGAVGHLQWVVVGLVTWGYVGITRRADPGVQLCSLMILLSLLVFFIKKTGDGVAHNAQFELVFSVAVGVGLAFAHAPFLPLARRYSPDTLRFVVLLAICVRLVASTRLEPVRLLADPGFHAEIAARERAMSATMARIKTIPGDVVCSTLACYKAGKPFVVDPFNCRQRMMARKLPGDAIDKLVATGRLTIIDESPLLTWSAKK